MNIAAKKTLTLAAIIAPTLLFSNSILSRINGSLGLEYEITKDKSKTSTSKETNLKQFVEFGYYDYIYSSNLLQYAIQTKFATQKTKTTDNGKESSISNKPTAFDVKIVLLQRSKYPAVISASKSSKPVTTVSETSGALTTSFESENYELNGELKLDNKLNINYNLGYFLSDNITEDEQQNISDNNYALNINKQYKNHAIYSNLQHHINETRKTAGVDSNNENKFKLGVNSVFKSFSIKTDLNYEDTIAVNGSSDLNTEKSMKNGISTALKTEKTLSKVEYKTDKVSNKVNLGTDELATDILTQFKWKATNTITLGNEYNTFEETFSKAKSFTENFSVNWIPTKNYNLYTYLSTTEFVDPSSKTTSQYANLNSMYNVSENLSTGQAVSYSNLESDSQETQSIDLSLNSRYTQPIFAKSSMSLSGVVSAINSTSTEQEDQGKTYSYDLSADIINKFDHKQSLLTYGMNYYETISTLDDEEKKIRLEGAFQTVFINDISYLTNFDYTIRKTVPLDELSETITKKVLNYFNGFQFSERLDIRGRLTGKIGLKYSSRKETDTESFSAIDPDGNINFQYRLWRTILFKSNLSINRNSLNEITTYRSESSLLYRFRKLSIELGMNINEQKGLSQTSVSNYTFMFKRKL